MVKKKKRKSNEEEGLMDVRVVYPIKQSLETGKPVKLESRDQLRRAQWIKFDLFHLANYPNKRMLLVRIQKNQVLMRHQILVKYPPFFRCQ